MKRKWSILGGGTAGLAYGYYFTQNQIPFAIYEAQKELGGASQTFRSGPFLFDSGAHRFHDKNRAITEDLQSLMKGRLRKIHAPSQIAFRNRFIDFPLSPLDLAIKLGPIGTVQAGLSLVQSKLQIRKKPAASFEDLACNTYGRYIAESFLLNYSRKLWGKPSTELSPEISGKRLKGLNAASFLKEGFLGKNAKTEHLDGAFYYPQEGGIGTIADSLAAACGEQNIHREAEITALHHDGSCIRSIRIGRTGLIPAESVLSTIPISQLVLKLDPAPPDAVISAAKLLQYRDLILVALFLDRPSVTRNASMYFPSEEFPFTRIYEPRNRNNGLAPAGKTSLVAEITCDHKEDSSLSVPEYLKKDVVAELIRFFHLSESEIEGIEIRTVPYAYPRLEIAAKSAAEMLNSYFDGFKNLHLAGRIGRFHYSHIHDHLADARSFCSRCLHTGENMDGSLDRNPGVE
jgi:protoporphyrinogen oxidase